MDVLCTSIQDIPYILVTYSNSVLKTYIQHVLTTYIARKLYVYTGSVCVRNLTGVDKVHISCIN